MSTQFTIYKCEKCGNIVELLHASSGTLTCCSAPMTIMSEANASGDKEKHTPFVEATANGVHVKVGAVPHVMEEKHWVQWIEVATTDGYHMRKFLEPGNEASAVFNSPKEKISFAREFCNLHGLWKI